MFAWNRRDSALSTTPATVRTAGCHWNPLNSVPSYSRVSRRLYVLAMQLRFHFEKVTLECAVAHHDERRQRAGGPTRGDVGRVVQTQKYSVRSKDARLRKDRIA